MYKPTLLSYPPPPPHLCCVQALFQSFGGTIPEPELTRLRTYFSQSIDVVGGQSCCHEPKGKYISILGKMYIIVPCFIGSRVMHCRSILLIIVGWYVYWLHISGIYNYIVAPGFYVNVAPVIGSCSI